MFRRVRTHFRQQFVGYLALFVALGGTTYAAATIGPNNIKNDAVLSRHIKDGQVTNADLGANSVGPGKVVDGSLTGADVKPNSGVDRCPGQGTLTVRLGSLCVGVPTGTRTWIQSLDYCEAVGLRLPTYSEARTLADNFAIPNNPGSFWTDEFFSEPSGGGRVMLGTGGSNSAVYAGDSTGQQKTVCVTTPTN
jgi:hypothetical protein